MVFTERCFDCSPVKTYLSEIEIEGVMINASTPEGLSEAQKIGVQRVPTVMFYDSDKEIGRAGSVDECKNILKKC